MTTSTSFEPVLSDVAASLREGESCAEVRINVADGRAAAGTLKETGADVWIPDDATWAGIAPDGVLAAGRRRPARGARAEPVLHGHRHGHGRRIKAAGTTWRAARPALRARHRAEDGGG